MSYSFNETSQTSHVLRMFNYINYYTAETDAFGNEANRLENTPTVFADLAETSAQDKENKTGITVMFEDFTDKFKSFHGKDCSNITAEDCEKGFLGKLISGLVDGALGLFGIKTDKNIFEKDEALAQLKEEEAYQSTLFKQEIKKNDGIVYAQKGEDMVESALNYAKADISAVEMSCSVAGYENTRNNKLSSGEVNSYTDYEPSKIIDQGFFKSPNVFSDINLDNDGSELSAEEYASYIIAADKDMDGKISSDEAQTVANSKEKELQEEAQKIYDKYFGK